MASFKEIQAALQEIRKQRETGRTEVFRLREELSKISRQKSFLLRSGPESEAGQRLAERERMLLDALPEREAGLAEILRREGELLEALRPFADPRQTIGEFSDRFPFLLFPVRLETRFRKLTLPAGVQHQLWVRIFPDDCSIDTFEGTLSESEVKNARTYWIGVWKAGQSPDVALGPYMRHLKKAAWRGLAGTTQAGRAFWITGQYQPLNPESLPVRHAEGEVILVIPTEELPPAAEQTALATYWKATWEAAGRAAERQAALEALFAAVERERALSLIRTYVPANLGDSGGGGVQVAFLLFPPAGSVATKRQSWSQAPRVTTFPERFVLMGTKDGREVINQLGEPVPDPLVIGPDPLENIDEVLREAYKSGAIGNGGVPFDEVKDEDKVELYVEYLSGKAETRWLFDFETAVGNGLGFRVDLTEEQYRAGFDRLLVLGVRLGADEKEGKEAVESLIRNHHFSAGGFGILPQGTPTNNTENGASGYSGREDADETFERYFPAAEREDPAERERKRDGRWLAELLGIDPEASTLKRVSHYYHTDQSEAAAMHAALWPATIGYFTESMLAPVFSDWERSVVRHYFTNHVSGRGRLPAIRIGDQPYGILPTSAIGRAKWLFQEEGPLFEGFSNRIPVLRNLYEFLIRVRQDWSSFHAEVAQVGQAGDPHRVLLEVLGLQAGSQEFYQRYAKGFTHVFNYLQWLHPALGTIGYGAGLLQALTPRKLLRRLGYDADGRAEQPAILEKAFVGDANQLKGPLIDDRPLSETDPIRPYTDDGKNYIEWLIESALTKHDLVREQAGFTGNQPPAALLYQMLRQALNLAFLDSGLQLYRTAGMLDQKEVEAARVDADFIGFPSGSNGVRSKWEYLYRSVEQITRSNSTIAQHLSHRLAKEDIDHHSADTHALLQALRRLAGVPTARLERAFVEHLDACTYRLDAWLLGLVNLQLFGMRYGGDFGSEGPARQGVYVGAFGWVENLKPDERTITPVELPGGLKEIFQASEENPLVKDDTNAGYVHAPSLNQAVTAAVLRNAYLSNASAAHADTFKVNLSSERVRMALGIIEGMQQGQALGALLGYQLERGLHDRYGQAEVDEFIYELRRAFPLASGRMTGTAVTDADSRSVTETEARNVVDGLALVNHVRETGAASYPFGKALKPATEPQRKVLDDEVERLLNINDAVADLAMAEGVHQVVQGNYDRAAGTLDAFSKGNYPPTPEVVQTPRSGVTLTHRVGIHLPPADPLPENPRPRVMAEPRLNGWLTSILPAPADVVCKVVFRLPDAAAGNANAGERVIGMDQLGLAPIDLIYTFGGAESKNLAALDDLILRRLYATEPLRPDAVVEIQYAQPVAGKVTFFELAPLIRSLRSLLLAARPLRPSDIQLPTEANEAVDQRVSLDPARIGAPLELLEKIAEGAVAGNEPVASIADFIALLPADPADLGARDAVVDALDDLIEGFAAALEWAGAFGMPEAGFGFVYDRRRNLYAAVFRKVQEYVQRWEEKLAAYEDLVTARFEAAPTEEERFAVLRRAEETISTSFTNPLPATAAEFRTALAAGKEAAFRTRLGVLRSLVAPPFLPTLSALSRAVLRLDADAPPLADFDNVLIDISGEVKQMLILAEDMGSQARKLRQSIADRTGKARNLLTEHDALAAADRRVALLQEAAKLLYGEDFQLYPAFEVSPEQGSELANCVSAAGQLLAYQQAEVGVDFPVDDWLYGVARVREKMGQWENAVVLAESMRAGVALDLTPLQLPFAPQDTWLALSYPAHVTIDSDKLLYTAYLPSFRPDQPQSGILIDEWTEVIPARSETTGLTFHYDKPNNEPPQSLLLVTPAAFTGAWQWEDLATALHETLDLVRTRAIEPAQVDQTPYAHFLPATVSAATVHPVTIALNYALNNHLIP